MSKRNTSIDITQLAALLASQGITIAQPGDGGAAATAPAEWITDAAKARAESKTARPIKASAPAPSAPKPQTATRPLSLVRHTIVKDPSAIVFKLDLGSGTPVVKSPAWFLTLADVVARDPQAFVALLRTAR
jgi:hypothetical protein